MISVGFVKVKTSTRDAAVSVQMYVGDVPGESSFVGALSMSNQEWQQLHRLLVDGARQQGRVDLPHGDDVDGEALRIDEYVSGYRD